MNKLTTKTGAQILHLLCEGTSLRSISCLTGVSIKTVGRFLVDTGNIPTLSDRVEHAEALRSIILEKMEARD